MSHKFSLVNRIRSNAMATCSVLFKSYLHVFPPSPPLPATFTAFPVVFFHYYNTVLLTFPIYQNMPLNKCVLFSLKNSNSAILKSCVHPFASTITDSVMSPTLVGYMNRFFHDMSNQFLFVQPFL